jgi:hypothetical protein
MYSESVSSTSMPIASRRASHSCLVSFKVISRTVWYLLMIRRTPNTCYVLI